MRCQSTRSAWLGLASTTLLSGDCLHDGCTLQMLSTSASPAPTKNKEKLTKQPNMRQALHAVHYIESDTTMLNCHVDLGETHAGISTAKHDNDETRGEVGPTHDTGFFLETSRQRSARGRQRTTTTRSVGGWIGKPRYSSNDAAAGLLSTTVREALRTPGEWEWACPRFLKREVRPDRRVSRKDGNAT